MLAYYDFINWAVRSANPIDPTEFALSEYSRLSQAFNSSKLKPGLEEVRKNLQFV
jgi:hypothetical protein